jgi:hypothetical protein
MASFIAGHSIPETAVELDTLQQLQHSNFVIADSYYVRDMDVRSRFSVLLVV